MSSRAQDHPYEAPSTPVIPIITKTPPTPTPSTASLASGTLTMTTTATATTTASGPKKEEEEGAEAQDTALSRTTTAVPTTPHPADAPGSGSSSNSNSNPRDPQRSRLRRACAAVRPTSREAVLMGCWLVATAAFVGSAAGVAVVAEVQGREQEDGTDHKEGWTRGGLTALGVCCAVVHGASTALFTGVVSVEARRRSRRGASSSSSPSWERGAAP